MSTLIGTSRTNGYRDAQARSALLKNMAEGQERIVSGPASTVPGSRFVRYGMAMAFVVGTGGLTTADYVTARNDRGYRLKEFQYDAGHIARVEKKLVRSSADNLARLREVFKPSVTELASILGVSRQAIYNWQAGQPVAHQNEGRLESLAKAADLLARAGIIGTLRPLSRKLPGGKTLLEALKEGSEPPGAVRSLVALLERERNERDVLTNQLSHRVRRPFDAHEVGSPHLDESA